MIPNLEGYKHVLIAPLHWGLGHAVRCMPLVDHYLSLGKKVSLAGDSSSLGLLKDRYPQLDHYTLPAYNISYGDSMIWSMLGQLPHIWKCYRKERKQVQQLVKQIGVDLIISDNRFGVYHPSVHNIYITHQTNILHANGFVAYAANRIHRYIIHHYDECWIPDFADHRLSGILSQGKLKIVKRFIGPLTRLEIIPRKEDVDILVLLSGPEPARSILAKALLDILAQQTDKKIVWINGKDTSICSEQPHIEEYGLVASDKIEEMISRAQLIICRSGYSTIMDIEQCDKQVIFVPTPGQTEQEYLAKYHHSRKDYHSTKVNNLSSKLSQLLVS